MTLGDLRARIDADLVTFSACASGLGKEVAGEGLVGLTRAFLHAGALTVAASLWKGGRSAHQERDSEVALPHSTRSASTGWMRVAERAGPSPAKNTMTMGAVLGAAA